MLIKLGNNLEAQVELVVTLTGIDFWDYRYFSDIEIVNSQKINRSKKSSLGMVSNLIGDRNNWKFYLWNELDETRTVEVQLQWYVNGELVATWIPDEAKNGIVEIPAGSSDYFSDSCKFLN